MAGDHPHSQERMWDQVQETRKISERSARILKENPKPSTFLGRKTQEPFPKHDDPIERIDIQRLINSELQPPKE